MIHKQMDLSKLFKHIQDSLTVVIGAFLNNEVHIRVTSGNLTDNSEGENMNFILTLAFEAVRKPSQPVPAGSDSSLPST